MHKIFLSFFWLILVPAMAQSETGWKAGASDVDITPDYPVRLSGFGHRTEEASKVTRRLHANALALKWKDDALAVIVTVDNYGVSAAVRAEVLKRLAASGKAIADERFALHSANSHSAPMLTHVLPYLFGSDIPAAHQQHIDRYTEDLTAKITQTVIAAMGKMEPARLDWSIGKTYTALNRRVKTANGYQMAQNFDGPKDRALPVLRVKSADGQKLIATHASYACHANVLADNEIHSDWAGLTHEEMELRFPGSVCLIAIGCGGDQNPSPRFEKKFAEIHAVGVAKEIVRLINLPMRPVLGPLNCSSQQIDLPFDQLPTVAEWKVRSTSDDAATAYHAQKFLSKVTAGEKIASSLPYSIQVWNYGGDLLTINLPGEVVVDYSLRFKREYDPARTWVNGFTNDMPCYIPSQRIWEEGGPEGGDAMKYFGHPARFAIGVEKMIAGAVKKLVPEEFSARRMQIPPPHFTEDVKKK